MVRRLMVILGAVVLAALGSAPNAWAQTELTGSDPVEGAKVAAAPERVSLTFSEPIDAELAVIFVIGADGRTWQVGEITNSGNTLTMPVTPAGPAGPCTIEYNIASDDPVSGQVRFMLTEPAPSAPASAKEQPTTPDPIAAEPDGSGGVPIWVWFLIGVVLVGAAVGVVVGIMPTGAGRKRR